MFNRVDSNASALAIEELTKEIRQEWAKLRDELREVPASLRAEADDLRLSLLRIRSSLPECLKTGKCECAWHLASAAIIRPESYEELLDLLRQRALGHVTDKLTAKIEELALRNNHKGDAALMGLLRAQCEVLRKAFPVLPG